VHPLTEGKALVFYALSYVSASFIWASIRTTDVQRLREAAPLIFAFSLPLLLIVARMISSLLRAAWFALAIGGAMAIVSAAATFALPTDAAVARVYRTFPFVALGATLAACIAGCMLSRPFNRRRIGSLVMHAGLLLTLAGAFVSLVMRFNGYVTLFEGRTSSTATARDYTLTLTPADGDAVTFVLPFEGKGDRLGYKYTLTLGGARLDTLFERSSFGVHRLTIFASDETSSGTAELIYDEAPSVLTIGDDSWMVRFGPSRRELPFSLTLDESEVEFYPASALPKHFRADVTISRGEAGAKRSATVAVNHPAGEAGYDVLLVSVTPGGETVFEVSRDPGAKLVFLGGAVAIAGLLAGLARRMKTIPPPENSDAA
jgi:hypothetical protein